MQQIRENVCRGLGALGLLALLAGATNAQNPANWIPSTAGTGTGTPTGGSRTYVGDMRSTLVGPDVITFEGLPAGTIVSQVFGESGLGPVTVKGTNPPFMVFNAAVIFDGNNPTGNDPDLGSPNETFAGPGVGVSGEMGSPFANDAALNNILIVANDLIDSNNDDLVDDPDDTDNVGSSIDFDFSAISPVVVREMTIIDVEGDRPQAEVDFYNAADQLITTVVLPIVGDNGVATVEFGPVVNVERMKLRINGSGGIDNMVVEQFFDCNNNGIPDSDELRNNDCNRNQIPDDCEPDCDDDGIPDVCDTDPDCDNNGVQDNCEPFEDCNSDGIPDRCQLEGNDCNNNNIPDDCDPDCDTDGIPDDCDDDPDCDMNGVQDNCEPFNDCNNNDIPDRCELDNNDCNSNGVPDECDPDCDNDGIPDDCDMDPDCDMNGVQDNCEPFNDCNNNNIPDRCELDNNDCNQNGVPDECDPDCDTDGVPDDCDDDPDCDMNGVQDNCEPFNDCNNNDIPDRCELDNNDCNQNGVPDECDPDCDTDGVPDDCDDDPDCDMNGVQDNCEPFNDCNNNDIPDRCELDNNDCNQNGVPDECDPDCDTDGVPDDCDDDPDCDMNGVQDNCEPLVDCNNNDIPDRCELDNNDCDQNGVPDECDPDCDTDGIPDDCDDDPDCDMNGVQDNCEPFNDCNNNDIPDRCELDNNDCNQNGVPDECDPDCDTDGIPDDCDDDPDCDMNGVQDNCEPLVDCNNNNIPDRCELDNNDCNQNGVPDECDPDCDTDGIPDDCDDDPDCDMNGVQDNCEPLVDCNNNDIPDRCELDNNDCDNNGVPDECDPDCDTDGVPDACDDDPDCDMNGVQDNCEPFNDCNSNGIPDRCELDNNDCDNNGVPDECDPDCDTDGIPDDCDDDPDCDMNGVQDNCEPLVDCNNNNIPDRCELDNNDCNNNGVPDECDPDCDTDGVPDDCDDDPDCDMNGVQDNCEPFNDCNSNGIPDRCELDNNDCNTNGIPDECEPDCDMDGIPDDCEPDEDGDGIPDDCEECPAPTGRCDFGCYELEDKHFGTEAPPDYGIRIDGLFGDCNDSYTFSFEQPGTGGLLCYDGAGTVTLTGIAYGGLDVGDDWDPVDRSFVELNFVYTGAQCVNGDKLVVYENSGGGSGTIEWLATGEIFTMEPKANANGEYAIYDETRWEGWLVVGGVMGPGCTQDFIPTLVPVDECPPEPDCDGDGIPDANEPDCDNDGIPDDCEPDCDGDGIPDDCDDDPLGRVCDIEDSDTVHDHPYPGVYGGLDDDDCHSYQYDRFSWEPGATWQEFVDGTARLTGWLRRQGSSNKLLYVDIDFHGLVVPGDANYPPPGSPYLSLYSDLPNHYLANNGGPVDPDTWHYYTHAFGSVVGSGAYDGLVMEWEIDPYYGDKAFQCGIGASGRSLNLSAAGWFYQYVLQDIDHEGYCFDTGDIPELFFDKDCVDNCVQTLMADSNSGPSTSAAPAGGEYGGIVTDDLTLLGTHPPTVTPSAGAVSYTARLQSARGDGNFRLHAMLSDPVSENGELFYTRISGVLSGTRNGQRVSYLIERRNDGFRMGVVDGELELGNELGGLIQLSRIERRSTGEARLIENDAEASRPVTTSSIQSGEFVDADLFR